MPTVCARAVATLLLLFALSNAVTTSGCATVSTQFLMTPESRAARQLPENLTGSYLDATWAWGSLLEGDGFVRLLFLPLLIDLPFSFAADVLLLPFTMTRD